MGIPLIPLWKQFMSNRTNPNMEILMDQVTLFQVAIWCLRQQADDSLVPMISNLEQRVIAIRRDSDGKVQAHIDQLLEMIRKGYTLGGTSVVSPTDSSTETEPIEEKKLAGWP